MDPLLSIVKYIFQINKLENNDKSIKSFFKNGKSFPQFIILIFPPDENQNKSQSLITPKWNNAWAYEYLSNKYPVFKTKSPNFSNEKWGKKFLLKILKILYFDKYKKELIEKSNIILHQFNVYFNDLNSIINSQYLLLILNVLTNGPTDIPVNFNDEFQPYFHIFDDDKIENKIFFLLQIQIIFNIYSERIYQLELNHANFLLLKFINFLSDKINLNNHFEEFSVILEEDFLFKFVYNFLNNFKYSKISSEMEKIEIKNINSVIKFLSTKENKFNFLIVDFQNEFTVESSLVIFFRTFFNSFFLKQTRKELFKRFTALLSIKYHFSDNDNFDELQNFNYYLELIHFLKECNFHCDSNLSQNIQDFQQYFIDVDIPMIVNQEILNNFNKFGIIQDMAFYQLQLIFNKLDSLPASYYIVETFLKAFKNLKSFKVPRTDLLKEKIIANRLFLKFQKNQEENVNNNNKSNEELPNNDKIDSKEQAIINSEIHESNDSNINNKIQQQNNENDKNELHYKEPDEFWNPDYYLEMFKSNNGLLYYEISDSIQHPFDKYDDYAESYEILHCDEAESYIIFYYEEEQNQWLFDEKIFNLFIEKYYKNNNKKIPIISYIDSNENNVISMNSKYCSNPYSKSKLNKIIVYATYGDLVEVNDKQKPIFLYLHVPEVKNNFTNLVTIIFQMYVFLVFISDINIIILHHESFIDDQIELIESIKNIVKGQDQIKKLQYLQNCLFDSIEDDEKNKEISFNNLNIFYVINEKLQYILSYNKFNLGNFKSNKCSITNQFSLIRNDNEINCHIFKQIIENIYSSMNFNDLSIILSNIKKLDCFYSISGFYFIFSNNRKTFNTMMDEFIGQRLLMIQYKLNQKEINMITIKALIKEISSYIPEFDILIRNECYTVIHSQLIQIPNQKRELIINELQKSSSQNLSDISNKIKNKLFLNEPQIKSLMRSHNQFIEDEFFILIQKYFDEIYFDIFYENNNDIIKSQKAKDNIALKEIFKRHIHYNEIKKTINDSVDINEEGEKKTNYVLKEKEIDKQIRIEIDANALEKDIEQDF